MKKYRYFMSGMFFPTDNEELEDIDWNNCSCDVDGQTVYCCYKEVSEDGLIGALLSSGLKEQEKLNIIEH